MLGLGQWRRALGGLSGGLTDLGKQARQCPEEQQARDGQDGHVCRRHSRPAGPVMLKSWAGLSPNLHRCTEPIGGPAGP